MHIISDLAVPEDVRPYSLAESSCSVSAIRERRISIAWSKAMQSNRNIGCYEIRVWLQSQEGHCTPRHAFQKRHAYQDRISRWAEWLPKSSRILQLTGLSSLATTWCFEIQVDVPQMLLTFEWTLTSQILHDPHIEQLGQQFKTLHLPDLCQAGNARWQQEIGSQLKGCGVIAKTLMYTTCKSYNYQEMIEGTQACWSATDASCFNLQCSKGRLKYMKEPMYRECHARSRIPEVLYSLTLWPF